MARSKQLLFRIGLVRGARDAALGKAGSGGTDRRRPREAWGSVRVRAGGSGSREERWERRAGETTDLGEEKKSVGWTLVLAG